MHDLDNDMKQNFANLQDKDKNKQYEAYVNIIKAIKTPVDWAYEVWDELIDGLTSKDNHTRSRSAQFLAYLAISDPQERILDDFSKVWEVTKDEKFVTARHSLQAIWRVGLAGKAQKDVLVSHLVNRYKQCENEKNYTLIRFDIIQNLKNLYDALNDEQLKEHALELIELETDEKYKKKYSKVWDS